MPAAALRHAPGPLVVMETLYWPRHAIGLAGGGRASPDAWMVDLLRAGVCEGTHLEFTVEDVINRFRLCIDAAHGHHTLPCLILSDPGCRFITDEGDSADSLDALIHTVLSCNPPWMYPLDFDCRVVQPRPPQRFTLTDMGLARG